MTRWIGVAVALGLIVALPGVSIAATQDAATRKARRVAPHEPRYHARPVYYRPYPYGVPAPFVLSFGPWW
ncbi:hypothetical protein ACVW1A_002624 [Bradyrhizobium sp. LB1.3]